MLGHCCRMLWSRIRVSSRSVACLLILRRIFFVKELLNNVWLRCLFGLRHILWGISSRMWLLFLFFDLWLLSVGLNLFNLSFLIVIIWVAIIKELLSALVSKLCRLRLKLLLGLIAFLLEFLKFCDWVAIQVTLKVLLASYGILTREVRLIAHLVDQLRWLVVLLGSEVEVIGILIIA